MTIKISVQGLKKRFHGKMVLNGIDLEIIEGESLVVIGMSGSGKSVLIKCILGLMEPDEGKILIDGENWCTLSIKERLFHMRKVGMLFQGAALFDSMNVWENVAFALLQQGMDRQEAKSRAEEMLERVGLPGSEMKFPAELSGGMSKRVGMARAICHRPEIMFYDEPLSGLDPIMSRTITQLICNIQREFGATSLAIAHNMRFAQAAGDRIALLHEGRIHCLIDATELQHTQDPLLRLFIEEKSAYPVHP
ncbi:MAG: ATP-binding cassette domain-containing protein [Mariprofundaceae bacterium]